MNRHKTVLVAVILAMMVSSCSSETSAPAGTSDNLVMNGGFEQVDDSRKPAGWKIVPGHEPRGAVVRDETSAKEGKASLRMQPNERNTAEGFAVFQMLKESELQGREVTLRGYVRKAGKAKAALLLDTDKQNWLPLPEDTGGAFVSFEKTFTISAKIPKAGLLVFVGGTEGTVWLDGLSLRGKTSSPSVSAAADQEDVRRVNTPGWQDSVFISPNGDELYFAYVRYPQKEYMDLYLKKVRESEIKNKGPLRPGAHGVMNFETYHAKRQADGSWGTPGNLNINSTYSLYSAKLSYDKKELYYTIREYDRNYGGDDIYVSRLLPDGRWSEPENLGPNVNTAVREDTPCLSRDGKTLYFARSSQEMLGWEIMTSERVNGKWTEARKMPLPINEARPASSANHQPFITADGKTLYWTRVQDMVKSEKRADGTWSAPQRVFPQLPVSGHASITADGKWLYLITATDKESLSLHRWTICRAERQSDGSWGPVTPVD